MRVLGPRARFLWNRFTPGGLGLEFTTTLAIGGVGMYVFALYVVVLSGDPGPTPLDRELLDLGDQLRSTTLTDAAKLFSDFGTLPACAAVVIVTSIVLAVRGRAADVWVLLLGLVLTYVAVALAKAGVDRPRPVDPMTVTSGSSFPSGHAAYATAWVAAAVALARRPRLIGAALVTGAVALAAAIGLSRIYLRAHFWSDVAGGWGLGIGIFGLLAVIGMVVEHMRHNGHERAPEPVARAER